MAVDDDPDSLDVIAEVLRREGAETITVREPTDTLPGIVFLMPDVLILDVAMPGEDGVSLLRRLRALPPREGGRIPAIALTALPPTQGARDEWLTAGFQRHLAKPFEPHELVALVIELSGHAVERRRLGLPPGEWPLEAQGDRRT
jgi:CheY-like chemotaxis protein